MTRILGSDRALHLGAALIVGLGVFAASDPVGAEEAGKAETHVYFGDLHVHTSYSLDAFSFKTLATPADAYAFARGEPVLHPSGHKLQLDRPLDFLAVTDHAEFMGVFRATSDPDSPASKFGLAEGINDPDPAKSRAAYIRFRIASMQGRTAEALGGDPALLPEIIRDAWDDEISAANVANRPGEFTSFIAFEWSAAPDGQNLHRNVIFRGDTAPLPFSSDVSVRPEDLWTYMEDARRDGHSVLAIPHNSNSSNGLMFPLQDSYGGALTATYASRRMANEPLVEVTQTKGTSETHPALSLTDEFADFEIIEQRFGSQLPVTNFAGGYVRDALRTGVTFQESDGFNPYKFGLVGATDTHNGLPQIDEARFHGNHGASDATAERRANAGRLRKYGASGLTGIWAAENSREALFDALARKETYATTGPRITVRLFAGWNLDGLEPGVGGWVSDAYARGVPMGGSLKARAGDGPVFLVSAAKDPEGANLDRIQIVKVWSKRGASGEDIFDVALSDGRMADPKTGAVPPVGNTVDLVTGRYTNSIGAVQLGAVWKDPAYDPAAQAAYYVRVLEIPTPRWTTLDAIELGLPTPADVPSTIQERAYTSPIWIEAGE
ncbi:MAG: DUF3604 domain-containing protein [Alphaproteobacteria bacterium]|nr:DUF3604 domain-containing protein [Alphaproteobacteria bacterium]